MSEAPWTEADDARNFMDGVWCGAWGLKELKTYETRHYGLVTGFVYFMGIGEPYVTHVKIGFTTKNPHARLRDLQTGCPFKIQMIGYVFGNMEMERELHDVLREHRCEGEWFEYGEWTEKTVRQVMDAEIVLG